MDVPTLLNNLKEEVTCSVCIHLYTDPKQLPCLHIFCLECLNNLARTSTRHGNIKCPICETEVAVPETGTMETLPSCFYVKNLLDVLSIKECNTSKVTCGNCDEKREEASYCFHCGKFWCKDCLNGHNILRENKEHRVLALKEFQDEDFEDVLKRPAFCQKELHEKEVLKFYCKMCEVPVCQNCVIVEHNKHDVQYLEVCAREVKSSIASKLAAATGSTNSLKDAIQEFEQKSRILEHRLRSIKRQIQEAAESAIFTIQRREEELIAKVENEIKGIKEIDLEDRARLEENLKKNEEFIRRGERLLGCTGAELVRSKPVIDEFFSEIEPVAKLPSPLAHMGIGWATFLKNQQDSEILQELTIGRFEKTATVANQCSIVGGLRGSKVGLETEFELVTRNSKGEQYYCPGDFISAFVTSAHGEKVEARIIDVNNIGTYRVKFVPSEAGQYRPVIQINGESLQNIPPININERDFKPVRFIGTGILKYPWGIAVNDTNEIFVSDMGNNRVVVFSEEGEFVTAFGQDVLDSPTGLVLDNAGRIFVASRGNNKIFLFKSNGEYLANFHNGKSLTAPRGISLDPKGNLVVRDTENKCVRLFSPDGKIVKTLGRGHFQMPFDCVCHEDKIFVSDRDVHLIKVYSASPTKFLYEFGRHGTGDAEFNPDGLAVDKTGHLLVGTHNHNVQVFTLEGKYVTNFGKYGEKLGEINTPSSISVLKSGHIVVCEFLNFRLQIFE